MGVSIELWRMRTGCFVMPRKCKDHLKTLKPVSMSLAVRLILFYILVAEGIESNPGPGSRSRGPQSPRGRGRGGRGGRGRPTVDIFAEPPVSGLSSQSNRVDPPYSLRRRTTNQPSVSDWLMSSQPPGQPTDSGRPDITTAQGDMDLASETSETDDNLAEVDTTSV